MAENICPSVNKFTGLHYFLDCSLPICVCRLPPYNTWSACKFLLSSLLLFILFYFLCYNFQLTYNIILTTSKCTFFHRVFYYGTYHTTMVTNTEREEAWERHRLSFFTYTFIAEIIIILLYSQLVEYNPQATGASNVSGIITKKNVCEHVR